MIGPYCFTQDEDELLSVIVEINGGRMTALTDSFVEDPRHPMTIQERLFLEMRMATVREGELN